MSTPASNQHQEADRQINQSRKLRSQKSPQITILFDESDGVASTTSNFYFAFDMSGSMDEKCSGKRKIDGAKEAVTRFMKNIPDDVNIGLMLFGTRSGDGYAEASPIGSGNKEEFLENHQQPATKRRNSTGRGSVSECRQDCRAIQEAAGLRYIPYHHYH
ncbi:MAG: VWA domain-containing protein [Marinilabiliales bacterium]|nr:VWA domain-containing protein [Marinilabiliales bacterium]